MKTNVGAHRRSVNRCTSKKIEDKGRRRSWRCQLVLGHKGKHISYSGHRTWEDSLEPQQG